MTLRSVHCGWDRAPKKAPSDDRMEAPPGFEPGMEVLQTGPGWLSC